MALFAKDESLGLSEEDSGEELVDRLDDENFGCGRMKSLPKPKNLQPGQRLSVRRRGLIDKIRESVRKPPRSLPPLHLPAWPYMRLDQKLPVVRSIKGTLFYARGTVGQNLYQTPKHYSNEDPFNQIRVITEPYNALHDPHARAYLQKPHIRQFLLKQGLITRTNQVLCSVKNFNKYRSYLNTLYLEDVHSVVEDTVGQHDGNRKMDTELALYLTKTEGKTFKRMQKMVEKKRELELLKLEQNAMKNKMEQDRQTRLSLERERLRKNRKLRAAALDQMRKAKLESTRQAETLVQERTLQTMLIKEQITNERIAYDKELVGQAYRQFLLEWLDTKWQMQEEKMDANEILEKSLEIKLTEKAVLRQKKVENYRAALPQLLEKQRAKKERLMNIVRKYFYRWLNNVRKRKARKPDAQHQSLWDTSMVVDETLRYLRKESGYEKLDDFILSILKLKRDIKAELAVEEEAERIAAAAAAAGGVDPNQQGNKRLSEVSDDVDVETILPPASPAAPKPEEIIPPEEPSAPATPAVPAGDE